VWLVFLSRSNLVDANAAAGADTITFRSGVTGTITLVSTLATVTDPAGLTVNGPGASLLTLSSGQAAQVFSVADGASLSLGGLRIADDRGGGGIRNAGTLTVNSSVISANTTVGSGDGGGIYSTGTLTVTDSTLSAGQPASCARRQHVPARLSLLRKGCANCGEAPMDPKPQRV
jgi:predicted outer membrane repeat protein